MTEQTEVVQDASPPTGEAATSSSGRASSRGDKKGGKKGCLIALAIVVVLVVAVVAAVAFGLVGAKKPKDLGVTYTEADYWAAVAKSGVDFGEVPQAEEWAQTDTVYSGEQPLDASFTPAEVSALFSFSHQSGWPVSDAQVNFTGGDGVEVSALVSYGGREYPVYVSANAAMSGKTVSGSIASAEVMGVTVPSQYFGVGESYGLGFINERLERLGGLNIETAEVVDGELHLVGTVPATADRVPRQ